MAVLPAVLEAVLLGGNEPFVPCRRIWGVTIEPSFEPRLFGTWAPDDIDLLGFVVLYPVLGSAENL